jgi:hypothetical protein
MDFPYFDSSVPNVQILEPDCTDVQTQAWLYTSGSLKDFNIKIELLKVNIPLRLQGCARLPGCNWWQKLISLRSSRASFELPVPAGHVLK